MQKILHLLKNQFQPDVYAGLAWQLMGGDESNGQLVILKKENNEITTVNSYDEVNSLSRLKEILPNDIPVYLNLHGKGILHKKVMGTSGSAKRLLHQILPNANPNDFYVQTIPLTEGTFCSVLRRTILDDLLATFKEANIWITGISIGPGPVRYLQPFIPDQNQIHALNNVLSFNTSGQLTSIEPSIENNLTSISIGGEAYDSNIIPAYTAAFSGLLQLTPGISAPLVEIQKEAFFHKRLFHKAKTGVLYFLLFVLLLNTAAYYFYKDKYGQIQGVLVEKQAQLQALDSLKAKTQRQQKMFSSTGINRQSRTSYYADKIGASLPKELQLIEMIIFPMKGKERDYDEQSLIPYDQERIKIKGICVNSLAYNDWIKELQSFSWVKTAKHLNYKDLNRHKGEFELELLIEL